MSIRRARLRDAVLIELTSTSDLDNTPTDQLETLADALVHILITEHDHACPPPGVTHD